MRILIADDDHGFRVFIRRVLETDKNLLVAGEAMDGEEAVRKTQKLQPDLVLMDMDMPGTDGLEATRRIKAVNPQTVIIMFSTLDGPAYREAALRSGADQFLHKLAPLSKIFSTIRGVSGHRAA